MKAGNSRGAAVLRSCSCRPIASGLKTGPSYRSHHIVVAHRSGVLSQEQPSGLEDPPKLEEPFVVAAIADAAAHEKGAQGSFGDDPGGEVVGEFAFVCSAIHFS